MKYVKRDTNASIAAFPYLVLDLFKHGVDLVRILGEIEVDTQCLQREYYVFHRRFCLFTLPMTLRAQFQYGCLVNGLLSSR